MIILFHLYFFIKSAHVYEESYNVLMPAIHNLRRISTFIIYLLKTLVFACVCLQFYYCCSLFCETYTVLSLPVSILVDSILYPIPSKRVTTHPLVHLYVPSAYQISITVSAVVIH